MSIRPLLAAGALLALAGGCAEQQSGPLAVAAIGSAPALANPNLVPLEPPSIFLLQGAAQGLVRFDAAGEIEPALAQSWIVSDDGLRYTFRIRRTEWAGGDRVTAAQVVARLRAATSRASRNPLKPVLGAISEIESMTDEVLEFTLHSPRPDFLQLLAQPEMAILGDEGGTGPYRALPRPDGTMLMMLPEREDEDEPETPEPPISLRGERAAAAVARFLAGAADLVLGGTAGDLPIVRAAEPAAATLQFDPVAGLFGLAFERAEGVFEEAAARRAVAMAIDRDAIVAALTVPGLTARTTLLPPGLEEVPAPAAADWAAAALLVRRQEAAETISGLAEGEPVRLRVAMPEGPGYRLIFAFLRRDWRAIGIEAEPVAPGEPADLAFVDEVAPAAMAAWYLRAFGCRERRACAADADAALDAARVAGDPRERRSLLAKADAILTEARLYVPIAAPVRWSLVAPRLNGFRRNPFGHHPPGELLASER